MAEKKLKEQKEQSYINTDLAAEEREKGNKVCSILNPKSLNPSIPDEQMAASADSQDLTGSSFFFSQLWFDPQILQCRSCSCSQPWHDRVCLDDCRPFRKPGTQMLSSTTQKPWPGVRQQSILKRTSCTAIVRHATQSWVHSQRASRCVARLHARRPPASTLLALASMLLCLAHSPAALP